MKKYNFKILLLVYSTLFAGGYCGPVSSHDIDGATLGTPFYATDVYYVLCTSDAGSETDYLETRVMDVTPKGGGSKVSAVIKGGGLVTQTGDQVRNDGNASPPQPLHAGNGVYEVFVHKIINGAKIYSLEYHCKSSAGAHTGTSIITIQNQ